MSFLDALKTDALAALHATANALHAQFARTLAQAGHDVTEDDPVEKLVQCATCAGSQTAAATTGVVAPVPLNYADAALATFNQSMTAALIGFAQQHLPQKFAPVTAATIQDVSEALSDGKISKQEATNIAIGAAVGAVGAALSPSAAAVVVPVATALAAAPGEIVDAALDNAAQIGAAVASAAAEKVLPGSGELLNVLGDFATGLFAKKK